MTYAHPRRKATSRGFSNAEVLAAIACLAVLFTLLFSVVSGARREARICEAESNLKQVSVALNLFYRKHGCLPPQGSDLSKQLAPYVNDVSVFENPLRPGRPLGETMSLLYRELRTGAFDRPNQYLTALASQDGSQAVVLFTGGRVKRYSGLAFDLAQSHGTAMETLATATTAEDEELEPVTYVRVVGDKGEETVKFEASSSQKGHQLGEDGTQGTDIFKIGLVGDPTTDGYTGSTDWSDPAALQAYQDWLLDETSVGIRLKTGADTYVLPSTCEDLLDLQNSYIEGLETDDAGIYEWPLISESDQGDWTPNMTWADWTADHDDSGWRVRAVIEDGQITSLEITTAVTVNVDLRVSATGAQVSSLSNCEVHFDGALQLDGVKGTETDVVAWRSSS